MNLNRTIVIDGVIQEMNISDMIDITNPEQVKMYNEQLKNNFKKSFYFGFGIKSFGLGNIIDTFTTITGIKWLIKKIFKECGCEKRKKYLNKWNIYLPYFYYKINLKFSGKELEVAPKTQMYVGGKQDIDEKPLMRSLVEKKSKGCGCSRKNKNS